MTPAPAAQARNISIAAEGRKCLSKSLPGIRSFSSVLRLYKKESKLEGMEFDVSALIRESRQRRISEVVEYLQLRGG